MIYSKSIAFLKHFYYYMTRTQLIVYSKCNMYFWPFRLKVVPFALCSVCIWTWLKIAPNHVTTNIMWWQRAFGRNSSGECTLNMGSYSQYNCNETSTFTTDLFYSSFPSFRIQFILNDLSGCRIWFSMLCYISLTWMKKKYIAIMLITSETVTLLAATGSYIKKFQDWVSVNMWPASLKFSLIQAMKVKYWFKENAFIISFF